MDGNGEVSPLGLLLATVVQTDLGVGHTTVVARLGVGLVLLVSVATSGSPAPSFVCGFGSAVVDIGAPSDFEVVVDGSGEFDMSRSA